MSDVFLKSIWIICWGVGLYAVLSDFGCDEKSTVDSGMSHNVGTSVSVYLLPFSHNV